MRKMQRSPIANIANPTNSEKRSAPTLGYLSRQVSKVPSPSIRSYWLLRSSTHSYIGNRPVNMTVLIGNFEGRRWVLKKWIVKIKPETNRASSECIIVAMFSTHPGRKRVKNSGNQSIRPESPRAKNSQKRHKEIKFLPIGPSIKRGFRTLVEKPTNHSDDVLNVLPTRAERIGSEKLFDWIRTAADFLEQEEVGNIGESGPQHSPG